MSFLECGMFKILLKVALSDLHKNFVLKVNSYMQKIHLLWGPRFIDKTMMCNWIFWKFKHNKLILRVTTPGHVYIKFPHHLILCPLLMNREEYHSWTLFTFDVLSYDHSSAHLKLKLSLRTNPKLPPSPVKLGQLKIVEIYRKDNRR